MENVKRRISLKVPAMATVWYIGSGALARAIGALSVPIYTRLLTPSEYGLFPLYTSWVGVLSVLVTLEITGAAIYRGFQKYGESKEDFASSALGLISAIFVGFCSLYFALYPILGRLIGLNISESIFMLVQIYATAVISLYLAKAKFEYKYKAVAALNLVSALLIPVSSIVLITLFDIKAESRIYSASIITAMIAIPIIIIILRGSEKLYSKEVWRYLLGRSIPLLPHYLATSLILKSSEISIGRTHGTEALGKYSIAMSAGMLLTIVTGGLISALSPWILRKIRENSIYKIRDLLYLLTKALSLLSLGILAIAPEIISFLAAENFRSALPAVYPLEIAVILSFISGAIMSGCTYFERGIYASLPAIISAAVSVLLSVITLPKIDYRFAGIFALLSYIILAFATARVFKRLSGEYPIHLYKSATVLLLTAAYAIVLFTFRTVFLSRIFLALPLVPLLILAAKDILKMVRE